MMNTIDIRHSMPKEIDIRYKWDSRTEFKLSFIGDTVGIMVSYGNDVFNYTSTIPLSVFESVIKIYHRIIDNMHDRTIADTLMHEDDNIVGIMY